MNDSLLLLVFSIIICILDLSPFFLDNRSKRLLYVDESAVNEPIVEEEEIAESINSEVTNDVSADKLAEDFINSVYNGE